MHPIKKIIEGNDDIQKGICSVCSASDFVIEAMLVKAWETNAIALIEATANQVNQFGGYTGMRPADFAARVFDIADKIGIAREQVVLGGDHLGPYPWRNEDESSAMEKAKDLVGEFVKAGFTKIHIDTSMRLGDDTGDILKDEVIASRALRLAESAQNSKLADKEYVFVLGSEVPVPGGTVGDESLKVTEPEVFKKTYEYYKDSFLKNGMDEIWKDVIAFVVQPGVEFGETSVEYYDRENARALCNTLKNYPGIVFEGHSTDYQPARKLKEMVDDGIKILKVGPALTFYQREVLFALEMVEKELAGGSKAQLSNFSGILEDEMLKDPSDWKNYYHGNENQLKLMRRYGLSDRCRYYLTKEPVVLSVKRLISNLDKIKIPYSVLSQYMPIQAALVNSGDLSPNARSLIRSRITDCLNDYMIATGVDEIIEFPVKI